MTLPRQSTLLRAEATRVNNEQKKAELEASPEYQERQRLKSLIDEYNEQIAIAKEREASQRAAYELLPQQKAEALSNPNLTARQKYSISQRFRRKKDAFKSSIKQSYRVQRKYIEKMRTATRAYNKNISLQAQKTSEARARSQTYREENNIVLTEKTRVNPAPSEDGTFINDRGKTITVKSGGTGVNDAFVKPQYRIKEETQVVSVRQNLFGVPRQNPVLEPTMTPIDAEPNTSTPSGAVYSTPLNVREPNTSTESGAVYSAPPTARTERGFLDKAKDNANEFRKGFFFTDGLNPEGAYNVRQVDNGLIKMNIVSTDRPAYVLGQAANLIPVGAGLKVVQAVGAGYKAYKASKFYQSLNVAGRGVSATGTFLGSQAALTTTGSQVSKFYETQQLNENLKGYDITPEEFRGVVSSSLEKSRKSGGLNEFGNALSTRFGTNTDVFESNVYGQLREKGLTEQQALNLLPVASRTRATRETIEGGTLVGTAAVTEIFGRTAFSASNRLVNQVFTKKVLREGTVKTGGKFTQTPLSYTPFKPTLTTGTTLGTSATTKGSVLYAAGFGEAAAQEYLSQTTRQRERDNLEILKQGGLGGVSAFALGVPIASSFELQKVGAGKGINTFANIVDPVEYPGDVTADLVTKGAKLEYKVPTITVGGTGSTPTYAFGTSSTQSSEYFYGANKGQDTLPKNDGLKFNVVTESPKVDKPARIKTVAPVQEQTVFPKITTPTESFAPEPIPQAPQDKRPVRSRQNVPTEPTVPIPIPTEPTVPIPTEPTAPVPVSPVVPVPTNTKVPIPITVPIPVVTATPREADFVAVGGGFASGAGYGKKGKRLFKYTPSAYSLFTGLKGKTPSKRAVKTGFSIRPITETKTRRKKGKKKKSSGYEELLTLGKRRNGRKRKRKRFAAF